MKFNRDKWRFEVTTPLKKYKRDMWLVENIWQLLMIPLEILFIIGAGVFVIPVAFLQCCEFDNKN